jgi:hypothetical protein
VTRVVGLPVSPGTVLETRWAVPFFCLDSVAMEPRHTQFRALGHRLFHRVVVAIRRPDRGYVRFCALAKGTINACPAQAVEGALL